MERNCPKCGTEMEIVVANRRAKQAICPNCGEFAPIREKVDSNKSE